MAGEHVLLSGARFRIAQKVAKIGFFAGIGSLIRERLRFVRIRSVYLAWQRFGRGWKRRERMERILFRVSRGWCAGERVQGTGLCIAAFRSAGERAEKARALRRARIFGLAGTRLLGLLFSWR